jgi:hypothetical protein
VGQLRAWQTLWRRLLDPDPLPMIQGQNNDAESNAASVAPESGVKR